MTKPLLLVMDMINDLVHADGPNGNAGRDAEVRARKIIPNTTLVLSKARAAGIGVGYVRVGFSEGYKECPPNSPVFGQLPKIGTLRLGTWGTEVHPDLAPDPRDFDIIKHRVSPFYGTSLEPILRANGIGRLYLCGFSTNGVVHAGVREGHDRDYECVVIEDCCAAVTADEHTASLACMRRFTTAVTTAAEVVFEAPS